MNIIKKLKWFFFSSSKKNKRKEKYIHEFSINDGNKTWNDRETMHSYLEWCIEKSSEEEKVMGLWEHVPWHLVEQGGPRGDSLEGSLTGME